MCLLDYAVYMYWKQFEILSLGLALKLGLHPVAIANYLSPGIKARNFDASNHNDIFMCFYLKAITTMLSTKGRGCMDVGFLAVEAVCQRATK
jgi:hypothetical protein